MRHPMDHVLATIATSLRLERPLLFLDLETTGTSTDNDRIVEIATIRVLPSGAVERWDTLVNPGRPIPAEATAVHHIGDADVADAAPFVAIAGRVEGLLAESDVAGFGVRRFDLKLLAAELRRAGVAFDPETVRVVDAMEIFHRQERRDLAAAAKFYAGVEHDGAHRAMADVEMTAVVLAAQIERYQDVPREVGSLAEWCEDRDPNALDVAGKIVWRDGAARISFGKWDGTPLRRVDPSYLRWMLGADFGASTKRIVQEALEGKFPTGPRGKGANDGR